MNNKKLLLQERNCFYNKWNKIKNKSMVEVYFDLFVNLEEAYYWLHADRVKLFQNKSTKKTQYSGCESKYCCIRKSWEEKILKLKDDKYYMLF